MEILKCQLLTCENQNTYVYLRLAITPTTQKSVFLGRILNIFEKTLIFIPSLSKINGSVIEERTKIVMDWVLYLWVSGFGIAMVIGEMGFL